MSRSLEWLYQTVWYIDPSAGNDENNGNTSGTALKTHAELERRIGFRGAINQITDVFLLGNIPASDPINVTSHFGVNGMLRYHGTTSILYNGTLGFSAVTVQNPATNTPNDVTDNNIPTSWTASGLIGARIRTTTGSNPGAIAWAVKDLGSRKARTSNWVIPNNAPGAGTNLFLPVTVTTGDHFVVESLSQVSKFSVDYTIDDPTVQAGFSQFVSFQDIQFAGASPTGSYPMSAPGATVQFLACDVNSLSPPNSTMFAVACKHSGIVAPGQSGGAGQLTIYAGYCTGTRLQAQFASCIQLEADTILQGIFARTRLGGILRFGSACIFDATTDAVLVETGGFARSDSIFISTGGRLWGNNNTGYGVRIHGGARMAVATLSNMTITGTVGDTIVGGTQKAWSEIPYMEANGAAINIVA